MKALSQTLSTSNIDFRVGPRVQCKQVSSDWSTKTRRLLRPVQSGYIHAGQIR